MKTITEFAALTLKNAAKTHQELVAAGKTGEELPAAMGEALKLEGDKLNHLMAAIEAAGARLDDLKRVIVLSLNEGEKAPHGAQGKNGHYYVVEKYPPIEKQGAGKGRDGQPGRGDERGKGRGGKRDKGKGRAGRDGRDDKGRGGRSARGPRREGAAPAGKGVITPVPRPAAAAPSTEAPASSETPSA